MRQVIQKKKMDKGQEPGNILKILLFWTIFIFIVFLVKRIIGYPKGNFDFIIKNILAFVCTIILSGAMLHFLSVKSLKISIPIIWISTIVLLIAQYELLRRFKVTSLRDTNSDYVPDLITEIVPVNAKSVTLENNILQSQKIITSPEGRTVTTFYNPVTLVTESVNIPGLFYTAYEEHSGRSYNLFFFGVTYAIGCYYTEKSKDKCVRSLSPHNLPWHRTQRDF